MATILTNIGATKIAAAIASNSAVSLDKIAIGDGSGSPVTPTAGQTSLVREVYRQSLNSLKQDPNYSNVMIAEITVPASVGPWTMREVGLIDTSGNLIVVGSTSVTEKPDPSGGSAATIVVRMYFKVSNTSAVTLTIDPSTVIATRSWVLDIMVPVGQVWITHLDIHPTTHFGIGTWVRYCPGKTPVFYDPSQTEFNALDKTGGSKTVPLAKENLPAVSLAVSASGVTSTIGVHQHHANLEGNTSTTGAHNHNPSAPNGSDINGSGLFFESARGTPDYGITVNETTTGDHSHTCVVDGYTDSAGAHGHSVGVNGSTEQLGSGTPINILQPFTVLYAWLRTA